jgi:hypothetical protein
VGLPVLPIRIFRFIEEDVMHRRDVLKWAAVVEAAAVMATAKAGADSAHNPETTKRSNQMSNANELVARYIAVWNEGDAKRRHDLVVKTWADSGTYVDAHPHGEGQDGIDGMIETAQRQFPGYQLRLISGIQARNGYIRFSWAAEALNRLLCTSLALTSQSFPVTVACRR